MIWDRNVTRQRSLYVYRDAMSANLRKPADDIHWFIGARDMNIAVVCAWQFPFVPGSRMCSVMTSICLNSCFQTFHTRVHIIVFKCHKCVRHCGQIVLQVSCGSPRNSLAFTGGNIMDLTMFVFGDPTTTAMLCRARGCRCVPCGSNEGFVTALHATEHCIHAR
jgi:hypothetical protein